MMNTLFDINEKEGVECEGYVKKDVKNDDR